MARMDIENWCTVHGWAAYAFHRIAKNLLAANGELDYDAEAKGTATLVELLGELH